MSNEAHPNMPEWWTPEKPFMVVDEGDIVTYSTQEAAEQFAGEIGQRVWTADPKTGEEVRA